jgi:hypothetical protein
MIMGRDPRFNIFYAQFVEPFEKAFFKLPQVANACDAKSCGEKFEKLLGAWFMENDMESYEGSQRLMVLFLNFLVMYLVIVVIGGANEDEFIAAFAATIQKKGVAEGIDFDFHECMGSGDMHTSCGNGTPNYISTMYTLIKNYCPNCPIRGCTNPTCVTSSFVLKGDDSYSKIPKNTYPTSYYSNFGFAAKIIIRKTPEEVEFCSGHFVEYRPGKYIYVQKLQKMLTALRTCINKEAVEHGWVAQYYYSLGVMYSTLYKGIPIYEDVGKFLMKTNSPGGLKVDLINSWNLREMFKASDGGDIVVDYSTAYLSVAMVNNMSYAELERIKNFCETSALQFPPQYCKRYNPRIPKDSALPSIDFKLVSTQAMCKAGKNIAKYSRQLKSYAHKHRRLI